MLTTSTVFTAGVRAPVVRTLAGLLVAFAAVPTASAQVMSYGTTYKLAWWNIQGGKGEEPLEGRAEPFVENSNCTDPTQPMNGWGVGFLQAELVDKIGNDPAVLALGLGESWSCGKAENVRTALGWKARSAEKNGVAVVARYGFAGPVEFVQLDTSLNENDTTGNRYIARAPICVDAACSASVEAYFTHWYATGSQSTASMKRQAQGSLDLMARLPVGTPRTLLGDLNVWEGSTKTCGQSPSSPTILDILRNAGYRDAWTRVHGSKEGYTGMVNRKGCGVPEGYTWKRIDYAWGLNHTPVSIVRFAMVPAGEAGYSDHYGLIAEFPLPVASAPEPDVTPPVAAVSAPAEGSIVAGTVAVEATASDASGVARVEFRVDGALLTADDATPFEASWDTRLVSNGWHTIQVRAADTAGNIGMSSLRTVSVSNPVEAPPGGGPIEEVVLYASTAFVTGDWLVVNDATAASGKRLYNKNRWAAKVSAALASPASYAELTFEVEAGVPYRLWLRGKADDDHWSNDSVYVQFSDSVDLTGAPVWRIGTTSSTTVQLEDCDACKVSGWGWQDNGHGAGLLGPLVQFASSGTHTIRIQTREDGFSIDQVVLSAVKYLTAAPGALKNDATILPIPAPPQPVPPPSNGGEIVIYTSTASVAGDWLFVADASAASGKRLYNKNRWASKVPSALAAPASYAELTFTAPAGVPYRLWFRGKADDNHWSNDSVYVQFSDSVDVTGAPVWRIGTTSSTTVQLEDCDGCKVSGWGWQDNGLGAGVLGPLVQFASSGTHTIRIQTREDGFSIDQVVFSPERYLTAAPGALKNDTTILAIHAPAPAPQPVTEVAFAASAATVLGDWQIVADATAASGRRLYNKNRWAPKVGSASATPAGYAELTFTADAGMAYRLWLRGKADDNHWSNDSVYVQFSDSVAADGSPVWRIGTTASATVQLEDCDACGVSGWGWQDNGSGAGLLGPLVRFAASGTHTIRIQTREDGFSIDQVVLSAQQYLSAAPGALKNDATIVVR